MEIRVRSISFAGGAIKMKIKNPEVLYLCLSFIFLNLLDAVITIYVIETGIGIEQNGILGLISQNSSLYHAMVVKMFTAISIMGIIYLTEYYDTLTVVGYRIEGIKLVYYGLVIVDSVYFLIVINGLIVLFFPTFAPFKTNLL